MSRRGGRRSTPWTTCGSGSAVAVFIPLRVSLPLPPTEFRRVRLRRSNASDSAVSSDSPGPGRICDSSLSAKQRHTKWARSSTLRERSDTRTWGRQRHTKWERSDTRSGGRTLIRQTVPFRTAPLRIDGMGTLSRPSDDPTCPRCQRVIERMEEHTYIQEETRIFICPRCRYEQELPDSTPR